MSLRRAGRGVGAIAALGASVELLGLDEPKPATASRPCAALARSDPAGEALDERAVRSATRGRRAARCSRASIASTRPSDACPHARRWSSEPLRAARAAGFESSCRDADGACSTSSRAAGAWDESGRSARASVSARRGSCRRLPPGRHSSPSNAIRSCAAIVETLFTDDPDVKVHAGDWQALLPAGGPVRSPLRRRADARGRPGHRHRAAPAAGDRCARRLHLRAGRTRPAAGSVADASSAHRRPSRHGRTPTLSLVAIRR